MDGASPKVRFREPQIEMAHGAGGKASRRLVEGLFVPLLYDPARPRRPPGRRRAARGRRRRARAHHRQLRRHTAAVSRRLDRRAGRERHRQRPRGLGRDSGGYRDHVPAGGGAPHAEVLEAEVRAMAEAARRAGVAIVGGDTKVVEHGKADRHVHHHHRPRTPDARRVTRRSASVRPGDKVLVSGPIGDHGITILLARGELDLEADLRSDTRRVLPLVQALVAVAGAGAPLDARSDPRRRGHLAQRAGAATAGSPSHLDEDAVPVRDEVRGACELLGLDPLHIANEGQFLAVVGRRARGARAGGAPRGARRRGGGASSARFATQPAGTVLATTRYGGSRIVDMLVGDPAARIC